MPTAVAAVYQESSQYNRWTFSTEELTGKRIHVSASAAATIRANREEELKLSGVPDAKSLDFPTWEEELLIVNYYASKVFETGTVFSLPSHLKATAAAYLRRFYLSVSPLQYHPKTIMITSLFLATKTCEHHIDLDAFVAKLPKQTKESVLEHEFLISSTIKFDFVHWSAYRPLYGFILDMESSIGAEERDRSSKKERLNQIARLHDAAKGLINACIWSDLPFLHSPSHLALAALYKSDPDVVQRYLENKNLSKLVAPLKSIAEEISMSSSLKFDTADMMAKVKAADRKLYYARDPALKKDSALYKRRLEDQAQENNAKRRRKGDAARESQEAFGSVLS